MPLDCCHQPNMLTCDEFLEHQGFLGSGYMYLVGLETVVQSGFNMVVASTNAEVELALMTPYSRSLLKADPSVTASLLRDAVVALEAHITNRSGQSINDYLSLRGLKVSPGFASLSSIVGTAIDSGNVG